MNGQLGQVLNTIGNWKETFRFHLVFITGVILARLYKAGRGHMWYGTG
jgi:hypothetical protein